MRLITCHDHSTLVLCTSLVGPLTYHVRRVNSRYPVRVGGHSWPLPLTLCGKDADRDAILMNPRITPGVVGCNWCRERIATS